MTQTTCIIARRKMLSIEGVVLICCVLLGVVNECMYVVT